MIKRSLYLDTTIPSYYYDQRKELDIRYRRKITKAWWIDEKDSFDLYISELVLLELQKGNYPQKEKAIRLVKDISILPIVSEIEDIVREYLKNYLMPRIDMGDAFHLAYASFYKIDYLLTWNCNHLANVNKKEHIAYISLFEKIFLQLLEIILTNQSGICELPPTGLKIFVHRAWDI